MEPPTKRARLAYASNDPFALGNEDEDEDEISMDPEEFAIKQDPNYRLERSRAAADNKLKSAFESLFEKYGKDFGDTGDEINFYTDEIEVDNGHIASLPNAHVASIGSLFSGKSKDADEEEREEERILHGVGPRTKNASAVIPHRATTWSAQGQDRNGLRGLSSLSPLNFGLNSQPPSFGSLYGGPGTPGIPGFHHSHVDPAWIVPDLPEEAFRRSRGSGLLLPHYGQTQHWPGRHVVRKALPAAPIASSRNNSDDDDLILGVSDKQPAVWNEIIPPKHVDGGNKQRTELQTSVKHEAQKPPQSHPEETNSNVEAVRQKGRRTRSNKGAGTDTRLLAVQSSAEKSGDKDRDNTKAEKPLRIGQSHKSPSKAEQTDQEPGMKENKHSGIGNRPSLVIELIERKHAFSDAIPFFLGDSPDTESLPTPPGEVEPSEVKFPGVKPTDSVPDVVVIEEKAQATAEVFTRNALDPTYAFSDDENEGLRKREPRPKSKPTSEENDTTTTKDTPSLSLPEEAQDDIRQSISNVSSAAVSTPMPSEPEKTGEDEHAVPELDADVDTELPPETASKAATLAVPAREKPVLVPSTPRKKGAEARQINPGSHRSSIISLVSDDSADEDELSLTYDDFTPSNVYRLRSVHTPTRRQSAEAGRALARRAYTAKRGEKSSGKTARLMSTSFSSPLLSRQDLRAAETIGPAGSPIQTPRGSIRRCGQDGFSCGRDFCFHCL